MSNTDYHLDQSPAPPYEISDLKKDHTGSTDHSSSSTLGETSAASKMPTQVPLHDLMASTVQMPPFSNPANAPLATQQAARETYQPPEDLPAPKGQYLSPRNFKFFLGGVALLFALMVVGFGLFASEKIKADKRPTVEYVSLTSTSTTIQSTTRISSTTFSTTRSTTSLSTATQTHNVTLTSISSVTATQTQTVTSTSISSATATQTQTATSTSISSVTASAPTTLSTDAINTCVSKLGNICNNGDIVNPSQMGDCEGFYQWAYCPLISGHECKAMKAWCKTVQND